MHNGICAFVVATIIVTSAAAHAGEQKVFKCKRADGSTVFASQPCGKGAEELKVGTSPKQSAVGGSGEAAQPAPAPAAQDPAIRAISDGVADSHCRDDARALYVVPDLSQINRAQAEIREIQAHNWYGASDAQIQLMRANDEAKLVSLRSLISSEEARADTTRKESQRRVDDAIRACDEKKRQRDAEAGR